MKGLVALAEWEYIHLKDRRVFLCFDSDYRRKKQVRRALRRFKKFLEQRGADVWVCWLPDAPDGSKQGLDDFFFAGGTVQELLNTATDDIPPESEFEDASAESFNTTDLGNAQRLIHLHGENVRYCHKWAKWLVWDGKRWRADDSASIYRLAKETLQSIYGEAQKIGDEEKRQAIARWAMTSESWNHIEAMIRLAAVDESIGAAPDDLDADLFLLNVNNGTIDLRSGLLRKHSRKDLITKLVLVDYQPDAKMPLKENSQ
ncbi:MAG: putative primase/helicase [Blastocatellia bacterium]